MSVKATSRVSQVLAAADLQRLGQNTINKLARAVRTDVIDRTSKQYNLSRRVLGEFVYIKRASRGNLSASINLRIRAVPLDRFGARVRMKTVRGVDAAGRKLDRKLPSVRVRIYRQGSAKDLPGAFPLYQRTNGPLREAGTVRKRTGTARDKLTVLRFYTFPRAWRDELLADVTAQLPAQLGAEFQAQARKLDAYGRRRLGAI